MKFLDLQVCRGCLATDTRMFDTRQHSAAEFTRLVELLPSSKVGLSPCVCYECLAHLAKMKEFHAKNQRAYSLLLKIIQQRGRIEETDIKQIDRIQHNLESPLKYSRIESTSIEAILSYGDVAVDDVNDKITPEFTEVKIEVKEEKKIKNEFLFEDFNDFSEDESEEVKTTDIVLDNKAENMNVKESEPIKMETALKKMETKRRKHRNVKNSMPKIGKKPKHNFDLQHAAENQKVPKVKKKQAPRTPAKVDPMKCHYTEDFHSFATLTVMTEEERLEFFKQRSVKQQYKDAAYQCTDCYVGFTFSNTYEKHRERHDPNIGAYVCPICKCRYKTQELQLKHIAMNHRTKFECKMCPFVCSNGLQARMHSKKHSFETYSCEECSYITTNLATYNLHVSTMHCEETPCPGCGVSFLGLRAMRAHLIRKDDSAHPKPSRTMRRLKCDCRAIFYNPEARNLHRSTSSKHNPDCSTLLSCALCDSRFTDKESLKTHMHTHPQEQKEPTARGAAVRYTAITCDQCGEAMPSRIAYRAHYRRLHPDKTLPANISCQKRNHKAALLPPALCDICGKIYACKYTMVKHRDSHTDRGAFPCRICGKVFSRHLNLQMHMNIHTKQYVYKCKVCGRCFNNPNGRRRHMLVHTEERLFPCDVCSKRFKSRVRMLYHLRYVHMKMPLPKRDRSKRKLIQQKSFRD